MDTIILKRQLITDATGKPVGVILPLEEYALVEAVLERNFPTAFVANDQIAANYESDLPSVRETDYFGMWADHPDLENRSSREWLEELRQQQWTQS
jgi:hypothetical protein